MILNGWLKNTTDMETNFNFKSQIATSRSQSERLLALGLKKETADMCSVIDLVSDNGKTIEEVDTIFAFTPNDWEDFGRHVTPRWSLHRLIEMMPEEIDAYPINSDDDVKETYYLSFNKWLVNYKCDNVYKECHGSINLFSNIISMYEWLIKEGYFNKEYLA